MAIRIDPHPRVRPEDRPACLKLVRALRGLRDANRELIDALPDFAATALAEDYGGPTCVARLRTLAASVEMLLEAQHFVHVFSLWRLYHGEYTVAGSRAALEVDRDFGEEGLALLGVRRSGGGRRVPASATA